MKLFKVLALLTLILFSPAAFSQVDSEETLNVMESIFSMEPAYLQGETFEYQHRYIGSIFGLFIFQIWGEGNDTVTPLAYAIGFVNIVAMLLAVITFLYVYLLGAIGTASDASLMGNENSATIIPIRTALGFGLLLPVPGIGGGVFSTIQLLIIWIIITGSNAASVMWYKVVDYIVENPEQVLSTGALDETLGYEFSKMLTCAGIAQAAAVDLNRRGSESLSIASFHSTNGWEVNRGDASSIGTITVERNSFFNPFSGSTTRYEISDSPPYSSALTDNPNLHSIKFAGGACGEIILPTPNQDEDQDYYTREYFQAANNVRVVLGATIGAIQTSVISPLLGNFNSDFERIREEYNSSGAGNSALLSQYSEELENLSRNLAYAGTVSLDQAFQSDINSNTSKDELRNKLAYGGWMNSIVWFYERAVFTSSKAVIINQFNDSIQYPGAPSLCHSVDMSDDSALEECNKHQTQLELAERTFDSFLIESDLNGEHAILKKKSACSFGIECSSNIPNANDITSTMSTRFSATLLRVMSGHDVTDTSGKINPFTVMSDLGHTLNMTAATSWAVIGIFRSAIGAKQDAVEHATGGNNITRIAASPAVLIKSFLYNLSTFIALSIAPVIAGLIGNGFALAYVIPFMPVLTWIAMLIGYLMMVIEAVIAAPLAVVMMFTPEGRGIVGTRLQSAINLVNACTLRPMLMTLGVLAGVQISYVAFEILNTFFWQVAANYLHGSVIDFFAILVIYTTSCYQICKLIVSAIPRLPDQIMDWMASGVGRSFGESGAMDNEAAVGHLSKGATAGFQGGASASGLMRNNVGAPKPTSNKPDNEPPKTT